MKDEVKIFESPQFVAIRTTGTSDEPLFCLADISHELIKRISDEIVNNSLCELDFKGI